MNHVTSTSWVAGRMNLMTPCVATDWSGSVSGTNGWIKISPVLIQDLDHNPDVLLWSADITSPVQVVADPQQPLCLMLTGLKVELHSVAWQGKKTPSFFWCPTGLHTLIFYGTGLLQLGCKFRYVCEMVVFSPFYCRPLFHRVAHSLSLDHVRMFLSH
jgi:hypothetical protein